MRYRPLIAVAASVAAADTLTKAVAAALFSKAPVHLPDGWALHVVHNNGVIGGVGAGTVAPDVFAVLGAVWFAALVFLTRGQQGPLRAVALGLILGGYIGNMAESRLTGHVVDWIRMPRLTPHLYFTFDLADVAVVCGQILILAVVLSGARVASREAVA